MKCVAPMAQRRATKATNRSNVVVASLSFLSESAPQLDMLLDPSSNFTGT
jgi:hypothetical protein